MRSGIYSLLTFMHTGRQSTEFTIDRWIWKISAEIGSPPSLTDCWLCHLFSCSQSWVSSSVTSSFTSAVMNPYERNIVISLIDYWYLWLYFPSYFVYVCLWVHTCVHVSTDVHVCACKGYRHLVCLPQSFSTLFFKIGSLICTWSLLI